MRDLIRAVHRQTGTTTLIVTHDQQEAVVMADRVALLLGGRLRQCDMPAAFFRRPADAEVARFFGAANFVPGLSEGGAFDSALGRLRLPEGAEAGRGLVTFRPEAVRLGPGANGFVAEVADRAFLGTQVRLDLRAGGQLIVAMLPPWAAEGIVAGAAVQVHVPPEALWVLPDDPLSVA
jgi:ABC-type Fe3+/spermidine/putrescine transport system ATPase subunit